MSYFQHICISQLTLAFVCESNSWKYIISEFYTVDILFYMDHTILLYLEIATAMYSLRCTT